MNKYMIFAICVIIGAMSGAALAAPSVSIDPASITGLSPGDSFSIDINVNPDGYGVSSGQIDLSFDPSILEVTDLTKGDMLGSDALDTGSGYDNTNGTITAVLAHIGATTPPTPAGTWATVTFTVKQGVSYTTTTISITDVGIADENFDTIAGITISDGTVTIGSPPSVSISPESVTKQSGATFSIDVMVDPAGYGVSAGQIDLSFNTSLLEVTSITKGDILGSDAFDTGSGYDNTNGTVTLVLARSGPTTPPTQAGTWATVTFKVKDDAPEAETTISIINVGLIDENVLDPTEIPGITTNDGTVTITTGLPGDYNGDGTVNNFDANYIARCSQTNTCPDDVNLDYNGDGEVNLKDAQDIIRAMAGLPPIP